MKFRSITYTLAVLLLLTSTGQDSSSHFVRADDKKDEEDDKKTDPFVPPLTDEDGKDTTKIIGDRPKKCFGLVLSDSHSVGPYQAGVIKGLTHEMRATRDAEYQVVSGISLGALNAHIFSQFPKGKEQEAA